MSGYLAIKILYDTCGQQYEVQQFQDVFWYEVDPYSIAYIHETGRRYGVREVEHMTDVKQLEGQSYIRARKRQSQTNIHQSVINNHAWQKNHTIDWEEGDYLPKCWTTRRDVSKKP